MTTITLEDGRVFPAHNDEVLSWDIGSSFTPRDEREGYPRTRAIILAMREHRTAQLENEQRQLLKASFDRMFGHNARKLLALIEAEA
jgi:hypothetical protein